MTDGPGVFLPGRSREATVERARRVRRVATMEGFTGVKVFSTTLARDRDAMGDHITRWLATNPDIEAVDKEVRQSSDKEFHCLTITVFYRERRKA